MVSVISPFVVYRWMNQVERDNQDRQRVFSWIVEMSVNVEAARGAGGAATLVTAQEDFTIWVRKEGALDVENVQFVILTDKPDLTPADVALDKANLLECELPAVDAGQIRIKLKSPLGPTTSDGIARDVPIGVKVVYFRNRPRPSSGLPSLSIRGAWLITKAAFAPIQINPAAKSGEKRADELGTPPTGPP